VEIARQRIFTEVKDEYPYTISGDLPPVRLRSGPLGHPDLTGLVGEGGAWTDALALPSLSSPVPRDPAVTLSSLGEVAQSSGGCGQDKKAIRDPPNRVLQQRGVYEDRR